MPSTTAGFPIAAAMLNPALLASVIAAAAEEYTRANGGAMPSSLAFLVAPLVLHRGTREALPKRTSTHWTTWLSRNPVLRAGFPPRARSLAGPVRDGLRFGLAHGALSVTASGGLQGRLVPHARPEEIGDMPAVLHAAGFVGKWLTKFDQPATAYALLGVAP
jgi:hypothetical protein